MQFKLSDKIELQAIKPEDQSRLYSLIQRIYPPVYKHLWKKQDSSYYINKFYSPENLKLELSDKHAEYYFIINNSRTVGILRFQYNKPHEDFPEQTSAYLHRIYLGKEAQGKGVAKKVFNWAEEIIKSKDHSLIWLKVMKTQEQAKRFYEKQGYLFSSESTLPFELMHEPLRKINILYKII